MATLLFSLAPSPRLLLPLRRLDLKPLLRPKPFLLPTAMGSPARAQPSSWRSAGRQQQWSCAICTLDNPGHSRACEACGNSRPVEVDGDAIAKVQTPPLPAMSASPARASSSSGCCAGRAPTEQKWSCAVCTLDNPGHSSACDACGNSRPVVVVVDVDALPKHHTPTLPAMSTSPARASTSSGCGAGRPPTEQKRSCTVCTLDNPGPCGPSRPVEVVAVNDDEDALDLGALAGASFLPLQRRSMKRERAASPGIVGACADEGDGSKGGEDKPAKKKGFF